MTLNALTTAPMHHTQDVTETARQGWQTVSAGNTPLNTPVDLHRALDEVRRMREFEPPQPGLLDEWLKQPWIQDLTHRLSQQFNEVLKHLAELLAKLKAPGMAHLPENIRDIFSGAVGFLIVMVGLFTVYTLLGWLLRRKQLKTPKPGQPAKVFEQSLLIDSTHHYQQAQQAAETRQYDEALRQLYMATLCLLDERAIVPYQSARTNLEYLEHLAQAGSRSNQAELKAAFEQLAQQFEASRYGHQSVQKANLDQSCQAYSAIQAEAGAYG